MTRESYLSGRILSYGAVGLLLAASCAVEPPGETTTTVEADLTGGGDFGVQITCAGNPLVDDGPEIQAALNRATPVPPVPVPVHPVYISARQPCYIATPIRIDGQTGVHLIGANRGAQGTKLIWIGNNNTPMFELRRTSFSTFEHFTIEVEEGFGLQTAIRIHNECTGCATSFDSQHNVFNDLLVFSGQGTLHTGIYVSLPPVSSTTDEKNDHHRFTNVYVTQFTEHGFILEGRNSKANTFVGCVCTATNGSAKSCVNTNVGNTEGIKSGAFSWYGGTITGMTDAAFLLGRAADSTHISGVYSEKSTRFLHIPTTDGGDRPFPIVVSAVDFESGSLTTGVPVIDVTGPGPLFIHGSQFGGYGATQVQDLSVCWHKGASEGGTGAAGGSFVFEGNILVTSRTTNPFQISPGSGTDDCRYPTTASSNIWCAGTSCSSAPVFVPMPVFTTRMTLDARNQTVRRLGTSRDSFEVEPGSGGRLCNLSDGVVGQQIVLRSTAAVVVGDKDASTTTPCPSAQPRNIDLRYGGDYAMGPDEALHLLLAADGSWHELGRTGRTRTKRRIAGPTGEGVAGTTSRGADGQLLGTSAGAKIRFPIDVLADEQLIQVAARVTPTSAADTVTLKVLRVDTSGATTTTTQLGTTASSSGATRQTLTVSGLTETASTDHYTYVAELALSAYSAGFEVTDLIVTSAIP